MNEPLGIKIASNDPYTEVAEIVERWCTQNYYDDALVTLLVDGCEITEILFFTPYGTESFEWDMDWWEGEKDIVLLGFRMRNELSFYGFPEKTLEKGD